MLLSWAVDADEYLTFRREPLEPIIGFRQVTGWATEPAWLYGTASNRIPVVQSTASLSSEILPLTDVKKIACVCEYIVVYTQNNANAPYSFNTCLQVHINSSILISLFCKPT